MIYRNKRWNISPCLNENVIIGIIIMQINILSKWNIIGYKTSPEICDLHINCKSLVRWWVGKSNTEKDMYLGMQCYNMLVKSKVRNHVHTSLAFTLYEMSNVFHKMTLLLSSMSTKKMSSVLMETTLLLEVSLTTIECRHVRFLLIKVF